MSVFCVSNKSDSGISKAPDSLFKLSNVGLPESMRYRLSRLSLYSMDFVKSTEFRITAESASSVLCDLHVLAQSFSKNNMQELFTEADPEDVNKQLRTAVDFYKNVIAGLSLSDQTEVYEFLSGREDYVSMQLTLLRNIAVVCCVISSQSKEAA